MNVALINLGCKVNRVETDSIALAYKQRGANLIPSGNADIVVINTCTVTGEAEKKTRKTIRRALKDNPHAQILVTGCAATINPEFFKSLDERISVVDKLDLLDTSAEVLESSSSVAMRVGQEFPTRVGVKVQDGCNHSCTYCIVHVARGRAWSRPYEDLLREVIGLASAGVKELVLTGIDLGSYCYDGITLTSLCKNLLSELDSLGYNDLRLRIGSIEPCSLQDSFIDLLATSNGRICRHLHLPLQSGSSKVLNEMNRPYSAEYFLKLVEKLYNRVPEISLSTDIIVGFPGESEEDFSDTLRVAQAARFSKIHTFPYSKRAGTPAAERLDQVDDALKTNRARQLSSLSASLRQQFAESLEGKTETLIVEGGGWAMTESYFKVRVPKTLNPGLILHEVLTSPDGDAIFNL